jgi:hypothetical protein
MATPTAPYTERGFSKTCTATAVSAANATPVPAAAAPSSAEPPTGNPVPAAAPKTTSAMARSAVPARHRAETSGACRPIGADELASSGLLVGASVPTDQEHVHQADHDDEVREDSKTTSPPIVSSSRSGPLIAMIAALPVIVCRRLASASGVSYKP